MVTLQGDELERRRWPELPHTLTLLTREAQPRPRRAVALSVLEPFGACRLRPTTHLLPELHHACKSFAGLHLININTAGPAGLGRCTHCKDVAVDTARMMQRETKNTWIRKLTNAMLEQHPQTITAKLSEAAPDK